MMMSFSTPPPLQYSYDRVGNITERRDTGFTTTGEETKTVTHTYQYDDLHRLTDTEGTYKAQGSVMDDTLHTYENSFSYDTIGNIMRKVQQHEGPNDAGDLAVVPGTTYTYNYEYNQSRPHAVASINDGSITFRYDASGNMTARYNEEENSWRTLHWDAENRLVKTIDNDVATNYAYDAEGTRVTKSGSSGEVTYVDPAYVIRNNSIIGKHVFVGNTRVASKMDVTGVLADEEDEDVSGVYYYHADHLGSSSVVTGKEGGFHERIEYFPYGETWVEDKASTDGYSTPYRYTAKEYDPETGLYYFLARYYDPKLSRWVSADPALQDGRYFPNPYDFDTEHDYYWYLEQDTSKKLPGIGGVFNAVNLDVYHYGGNNPVKLVDPDGNLTIAIEYNRNSPTGGIAFQLFENGQAVRFYDSWVTRGVNKSGQDVAIKSGKYQYEINYFSVFQADTPRLNGTMEGSKYNGGKIPTEGPNVNHSNRKQADGIRIHKMRDSVKENDPNHGGKPYVWSEGCQGPQGEENWDKFMKGKKGGDKGEYLLIRPKEIIKDMLNIGND